MRFSKNVAYQLLHIRLANSDTLCSVPIGSGNFAIKHNTKQNFDTTSLFSP